MTFPKTLLVTLIFALTTGAWSTSTDANMAKWNDHTGDMTFVVGYEKGLEQAKATGKPMFLFFTTTWCGWCKKFAGESLKDPAINGELVGFIPVIVDGDTEKSVCSKFNVSGYPNLKFVSADGKVLTEARGYQNKSQFKEKLSTAYKALGKIELNPKYLESLEKTVKHHTRKKDYRKALLAILELEKAEAQSKKIEKAKKKIEDIAAKNFERAKKIHAKSPEQAKELLEAIRKTFVGLNEATEAANMLEADKPTKG